MCFVLYRGNYFLVFFPAIPESWEILRTGINPSSAHTSQRSEGTSDMELDAILKSFDLFYDLLLEKLDAENPLSPEELTLAQYFGFHQLFRS